MGNLPPLTAYHKHSPNFYCDAFSVFLTSPVFLPRKQLLLVQIGSATRVPGHLKTRVNPPLFKPVNPGLCAGKTPGFPGLMKIPDKRGSTTVVVNQQVVVHEQMELAIKSSLTQPLCNTMNDKSMLDTILF